MGTKITKNKKVQKRRKSLKEMLRFLNINQERQSKNDEYEFRKTYIQYVLSQRFNV